jgi:hypothetical protein
MTDLNLAGETPNRGRQRSIGSTPSHSMQPTAMRCSARAVTIGLGVDRSAKQDQGRYKYAFAKGDKLTVPRLPRSVSVRRSNPTARSKPST